MPKQIKKNSFIIFFFIFIFAGAYFWLITQLNAKTPSRNGDNAIYFNSAYNIKKFSINSGQINSFRIYSHKNILKPPLYSFLLSFGFLEEDLDNNLACVYIQKVSKNCKKMLINVKKINAIIHLFFSVSVFLILKFFIKSNFISFLGFLMIFFSTFFLGQINNFMTETTASLLILIHSFLFYRMFSSKNLYKNSVLCGFCLGLLILTKAIFLYWLYILILIYFINCVKLFFKKKLYIYSKINFIHFYKKYFVIFIIFALLPSYIWMTRNFLIDGNFKISSQGGNVIAERAEFLNYPISKYHYGFLWYLPDFKKKHDLISKIGKNKFIKFDESYPESFYGLSDDYEKGYVLSKLSLENKENADALFKKSLNLIIQNPIKNLYLNFLFLTRATFINTMDNQFNFILKVFSSITHWPTVMGLIIFCCYYILSKNKIFIFILPSIFSIIVYVNLTDFESRYASINVAIFLIIAINHLVKRSENKSF